MEDIKEQKLEENIGKKEKIKIEKEIISNNKTNNDTQIFENINSPQKIQHFLQLSTHSNKKGLELEQNIIQSLLSINNIIIDILDDDIGQNIFNPIILTQNKKNNLYKLNFEEVNISNNFLNQNIKQYNELKGKISEYNSLKSEKHKKTEKPEKSEDNSEKLEKKEENEEKINENIKKYLYFIQHPLIKIFEEEKKINIKQLKNEINNDYLNKMKDNTKYNHLQNLINLQMILNENNDNNENNVNNDEDNDDDNEDEDENEDDDDYNLNFYEHFYSSNSSSHESNENVNNAPNNIQSQNVPIEVENNNQNSDNIQVVQIINPNDLNNDQNNINVQNNENEQNNAQNQN